jgi:23S rRNA U2552 (ribose-2'-O)-methylase RlmE/FtsJ
MLWQYFLGSAQKNIVKARHYFPIYERHFSRYINQPLVFWEIGVFEGGSLQMWRQYFGPHATIVGIDINKDCKQHEEDNIHVCIGNQSDHVFLEEVLMKFGPPDIVLDDGSHKMSDIKATFSFLYDKLQKNGIYLVEDLHTAYWEEYEGGLRKNGTFIEYCKELIDELNAFNTRGTLEPTKFTKETSSIHFYDSVIVFERALHTPYVLMYAGANRRVPQEITKSLEDATQGMLQLIGNCERLDMENAALKKILEKKLNTKTNT